VSAAVCAAVVAVTPATPQAGERPVGELRDCRSRGEGRGPQKPPPAGGVRIGPLLLWPSIRGRPSRSPLASEWPLAIKAPVVLPARSKVVLAVAQDALGRAAFQHGGRYVTAVRFEACRERVRAWSYDGTVGKLTGFPFAIGLTQRSACVPMEVWVDGRVSPIRRVVPLGRRSC
jgi:hypothetical protein